MERVKHFSYICQQTNNRLNLFKLDLKHDFILLYNWIQQPHVYEFWQLAQSQEEELY